MKTKTLMTETEPRVKPPRALRYFHAEIKNAATEEDLRKISGYASTEDLDRGNEITHREAFRKSLHTYLRNPVLCYMHQWERVIGRVTSAGVDAVGLFVEAEISSVEDEIWTKIIEGSLRAFSFGFKPVRWQDETRPDGRTVRHLLEIELYEISVVSIPMNRNALFSVRKSLDFGTDVECRNGSCLDPGSYLQEQGMDSVPPEKGAPPSGRLWRNLALTMVSLFRERNGTEPNGAEDAELFTHLAALYRKCGKTPPDLRIAESSIGEERKSRWESMGWASVEKESKSLRITGHPAKEEALGAGLPAVPVFFHGEKCVANPPAGAVRKSGAASRRRSRTEVEPLLESLCRAVLNQQNTLFKIARALDPLIRKKRFGGG